MAKTNRNNKPWKSSEIQVKKDSKGIFWVVLGDNKVKLPKDIKPSKLTLSQAEGFLGLNSNENTQEQAPWMKGNKFWQQRSKHGRDKLFKNPELLLEAAAEYFQWCDENPWVKSEAIKSGELAGQIINIPTSRPYTIQGLCNYLGCSTEYLRHFEDNNKNAEDFMPVITYIREVIYQQKFEGATVGVFNANIIARDLGLTDKKEQEVIVTERPLFGDEED